MLDGEIATDVAGAAAALDGEPPRARRRRHRHRQDEDPADHGRPALRRRRARVRLRREGRPHGDLAARRRGGRARSARGREQLGITYEPRAHPVELLSLSGALGAQVRATVSSFGPLLLGKVLDLNKTQVSVLTLVFAYCDDQRLPLLDLADLRTTLKFLSSDEGETALKEYGGFSKATIGVLLRSIVELEAAGADAFFGEPEFDVARPDADDRDGRGVVSLLELADVMDRPRLFSTFMLWMLAQLYATLPEVGDLPKPKLAFFFDEAHLLFDDASEALLEQIELTARLIRSKGVGVYFVTQSPTDVPSSVLSQLGNRVQHALRAFTPDDETNLRKTVKTFPKTRRTTTSARRSPRSGSGRRSSRC